MKRSDIKRPPLADTVLASLEPEQKEYREAYGVDRLYFVVSVKGNKRWEFRYKRADGKWSWVGLGAYPDVSAKRVRQKAFNVAKKTGGWVKQIFSQAIASGLCENNPASELLAIAAPAPKTEQHPHLLEHDLPEFMNAMKKSRSRVIARTAAWLTIRTASRPGMVRYAEWRDIDLETGTWTVPAAKMKMSRDQIVPLPTQAVAALQELHEFIGRHQLVFPGIGKVNPVTSKTRSTRCSTA